MPSGFCVRVLLLSLLAFGPHAKALSYRSGGSGGIEPYFQVAEDFPGNHRPGLTLSSYESSAQPRGSLGSSGPSAGGYSDSYGRQVDGYSRERSVSSYKPDPMIRTKPRENPQQPRYQNNANIPQTKAGMWDVAFPQNVNRFESGIVSSHGIEMHSGRQSEDKPQQPKQPVYPPKPQQQPKQPVYPPKPQQPSYLAKPSVTQSKAGMWDFALSQDGAAFDPNEQPTDSAQPRSYDSWPATFQHQYLRSLRVHQ
ncbi:proline-rich protein 4-like [Lates japonicus]